MTYLDFRHVVVNIRVDVIEISGNGNVDWLDHELVADLMDLVSRRRGEKRGVRIISVPLVCNGVETAVGKYLKHIASRGETFGITDCGTPTVFVGELYVCGSVGRVVVRHGPDSVLPHCREIETIIQRAFYEMQGHVSAEGVRLHPMLLNPHIAIFATGWPSVNVVLEMSALPPIVSVCGRCCLEGEYGVMFG